MVVAGINHEPGAARCGRGHSWAKATRGPSSQRHVELCTTNSVPTRIATFDRSLSSAHELWCASWCVQLPTRGSWGGGQGTGVGWGAGVGCAGRGQGRAGGQAGRGRHRVVGCREQPASFLPIHSHYCLDLCGRKNFHWESWRTRARRTSVACLFVRRISAGSIIGYVSGCTLSTAMPSAMALTTASWPNSWVESGP